MKNRIKMEKEQQQQQMQTAKRILKEIITALNTLEIAKKLKSNGTIEERAREGERCYWENES